MASPQNRLNKLIGHLWSYRNSITWILIIAALTAFAALPLTAQKGYMDEKALVVGAMGLSIHELQGADAIYNQLKKDNDVDSAYSLLHRASELSLSHNEKILPPPPIWHYQNDKNKNLNTSSRCRGVGGAVHAVITGGRGDGTETLVLAFPITPGTDTAKLTAAIGVQAARHLSGVSWLAKNLFIVFLEVPAMEERTVSDEECSSHSTAALNALESWLTAMDLQASVDEKTYTGGGGLIQQGIILDIRTIAATEARLSVHGYNGQLPNLDLVVLTKKNLDFYTNFPHGVGLDVGNAPAVKTSKESNTLRQQIRTSVIFARYLALGKPTGAHAALLHRGADALSLIFTRPELTMPTSKSISVSAENKDSSPESAKIKDSDVALTSRNALNAIEMVIRTCNNLHERLHHANAMYLLIDADHFVNVGACMAPPGILLAALVLIVTGYIPGMSMESEKEKKGALVAVAVHAAAVAGAALFLMRLQWQPLDNTTIYSWSDLENNKLIQILSTFLAGVLIFIKLGSSWTQQCLFSDKSSTSAAATTNKTGKSSEFLRSFIGVCAILVLIEAAGLLLWRWALSFTLLALTVPLLHLLSYAF